LLDGVLDAVGVTVVGEAVSEPGDDPRALFDRPQQHAAAIAADVPAIESGDDVTPPSLVKVKQSLGTPCHCRPRPCVG